MSNSELNDIITALRKYGMKIPKTVTTAKELAVSILSQCEDIDEGEEQEATPTPTTPPTEPVEMSTTGTPGKSRRDRVAAWIAGLGPNPDDAKACADADRLERCVAEQARLAKKYSGK